MLGGMTSEQEVIRDLVKEHQMMPFFSSGQSKVLSPQGDVVSKTHAYNSKYRNLVRMIENTGPIRRRINHGSMSNVLTAAALAIPDFSANPRRNLLQKRFATPIPCETNLAPLVQKAVKRANSRSTKRININVDVNANIATKKTKRYPK